MAIKYETFEISLTTSNSYSNPYINVSLSAIFNGPNNKSIHVNGFWDGNNNYKIRFTPTIQGLWTYIISSSDSELNGKNGSFNVDSQLITNHGFLRKDIYNPYSFIWDDGTRYFMWGQTYYEIIRNAQSGISWKTAIDNTKNYGINKVRMLIYPWPAVENHYTDSQPFTGSSSSPNHDQLNLSHWQKFDEIIQYLDSKNMIAELIIFSDSAIYGLRAFGTQAQDERYIRYILARFASYHNVIWCLSNEWDYTQKSKSYWNTIGSIIKNEDPWMNESNFLRPLSIHQMTRIDFEFFNSLWPSHAVIQYGIRNKLYSNGDEWGNKGILYNMNKNMPVVNDEYGYIGESPQSPVTVWNRDQHRHVIWGISTAGGYGCVGDIRFLTSNNAPIFTSDWIDSVGEYSDIKMMLDFFNLQNISYWIMSSKNSLITNGSRVYVLGNFYEYVIYAAIGGTFSINLPQSTLTYKVLRYNPQNGVITNLPNITGGTKSFTMPDSNDWILYIYSSCIPSICNFTISQK